MLSIAEAARQIADRSVSPVELTRACLDRIDKLDGTLNAFIRVTPERAMADARAAEQRQMGGTSRGRLDGIPIGHKDIYGTAGIPTTAHSKLLQNWVPDTDATTVRLLHEAGTVMIGKLATHEFAFGGPSFDLPWPPARNPWDPAHFTSGSSSGTGAAVAAGLVYGGTGSDTGGSIRGPRIAVRHRRDQTDLRAVQPGRHPPARLLARPCRAAGVDGRGLRHPAAGDGRP